VGKVLLLLLLAYVPSYGTVHWLLGNQFIRPRTFIMLNDTLYAPLASYAQSDSPGSRWLERFSTWCHELGR
jgi:hypothetical protein